MPVAKLALAKGKTLTISQQGFSGDKFDKYTIKPFTEKCSCELMFKTGSNVDRLNKIQIRKGKGVDIDSFTEAYSQIGSKEGCSQLINKLKVMNLMSLRHNQGTAGRIRLRLHHQLRRCDLR